MMIRAVSPTDDAVDQLLPPNNHLLYDSACMSLHLTIADYESREYHKSGACLSAREALVNNNVIAIIYWDRLAVLPTTHVK